MSEYKHGIETSRSKTKIKSPVLCTNNITVAIGTAPINTVDNVQAAVNKPIALYEKGDAEKIFGSKADMRYTLEHSIYASFNKYGVAPIVLINVLDPSNTNHVEVVSGQELNVVSGRATIEECGVLLDKLQVTYGESECKPDEDYVTSFNDDGYAVIAVPGDGALSGAEKITVSYAKLNPDGVSSSDIIGGVTEDGVRTGIELLDEIYARYGIVPGYVTAPGFSKNPAVAAALEAKVQKIYALTNAVALVDLDSSDKGATHFSKVKEVKNKNVVASRCVIPFWPMTKADGYQIYYSAMAAAAMQKQTVQNNNIPSESPDNTELLIDGICLEDGTDVFMTQDDVNDYLNRYGVVGALKLPGWKIWGNNTAAYPVSNDPIDRWINNVVMLNFIENKFKTEYLSTVGRNGSYKLVSGIVNEFNMYLNSLTPDYLAGGSIVFDRSENPIENIMNGHYKFHTRYAAYIPSEYIENEFEYDVTILESALEGGE